MRHFETEYLNLGYLDSLADKNTFVHRIDPRIKLLVSFAFILLVVSFPRYEVSGLMPLFIYPVFLLTAGDIPLRVIAKKVVLVSPFVIFMGIFNPLLDTEVVLTLYGVPITNGWLSFISILIKFILTVSTALLLIATTSFTGLCGAMESLKLPRMFVIQLLFLYRYLFVLFEEALRMARAKESRSFGKNGRDIKTFIKLISVLLLRAVERAERIYQAMLSRGFRGEIRILKRHRISTTDILFALFSLSIFYVGRQYNLTYMLGQLLEAHFR